VMEGKSKGGFGSKRGTVDDGGFLDGETKGDCAGKGYSGNLQEKLRRLCLVVGLRILKWCAFPVRGDVFCDRACSSFGALPSVACNRAWGWRMQW